MKWERSDLIDAAFQIARQNVSQCDEIVFYDYVAEIEDTELFELGPSGVAGEFLEFIYETMP